MIENNKLNNTKHTAVIPTQVGIWNVESKKPFCPISFCSKMTGPAASNGIFVPTSILRQCVYRIEFGCFIGRHKAERDADSGRAGDRPR